MQMFAYRNTEAGIALRQKIATFETSAVFTPPIRKWTPVVVMTPFKRIEQRACRVFKISLTELKSARRDRGVSLARQFIYYWACRLTTMSLPQVGRLIGGRDHTTVLHGKDRYVELRKKMGRNLRKVR